MKTTLRPGWPKTLIDTAGLQTGHCTGLQHELPLDLRVCREHCCHTCIQGPEAACCQCCSSATMPQHPASHLSSQRLISVILNRQLLPHSPVYSLSRTRDPDRKAVGGRRLRC